jgi:hypothetical protein
VCGIDTEESPLTAARKRVSGYESERLAREKGKRIARVENRCVCARLAFGRVGADIRIHEHLNGHIGSQRRGRSCCGADERLQMREDAPCPISQITTSRSSLGVKLFHHTERNHQANRAFPITFVQLTSSNLL